MLRWKPARGLQAEAIGTARVFCPIAGADAALQMVSSFSEARTFVTSRAAEGSHNSIFHQTRTLVNFQFAPGHPHLPLPRVQDNVDSRFSLSNPRPSQVDTTCLSPHIRPSYARYLELLSQGLAESWKWCSVLAYTVSNTAYLSSNL